MESFVARHVAVQLLYSGNMENTTVGPNGEQVGEAKFLGVVGRRQFVTLGLFFLALLPALIVDDLGPVLSITGALGASCVAYIAPGLLYLGIHGGDFLGWASGAVHIRQSDPLDGAGVGEIELPVVGNAAATIVTSSHHDRTTLLSKGRKPWWWYLVGMPLWIAIATKGERGTREFLQDSGLDSAPSCHESKDQSDWMAHTVGPKHRDFVISIVFVVFGIVAAICGVASNVYVEINDIFFTPH